MEMSTVSYNKQVAAVQSISDPSQPSSHVRYLFRKLQTPTGRERPRRRASPASGMSSPDLAGSLARRADTLQRQDVAALCQRLPPSAAEATSPLNQAYADSKCLREEKEASLLESLTIRPIVNFGTPEEMEAPAAVVSKFDE